MNKVESTETQADIDYLKSKLDDNEELRNNYIKRLVDVFGDDPQLLREQLLDANQFYDQLSTRLKVQILLLEECNIIHQQQ